MKPCLLLTGALACLIGTAALAQTPAAPKPKTVYDIVDQAERDAGKADREVRKEEPHDVTPLQDSRMKRLASSIEAATAPPRLGAAPKIEEIPDQGGYGRRIYKVTTAATTYCVTYESNHAPDGRDSMRDGLPPKITTCPREK
jgi:hypothetical protein